MRQKPGDVYLSRAMERKHAEEIQQNFVMLASAGHMARLCRSILAINRRKTWIERTRPERMGRCRVLRRQTGGFIERCHEPAVIAVGHPGIGHGEIARASSNILGPFPYSLR